MGGFFIMERMVSMSSNVVAVMGVLANVMVTRHVCSSSNSHEFFIVIS